MIAVFGAGRGLGRAVAHRFGREGHRVALIARRPDALDALVAELAVADIDAAAFPADVADRAALSRTVDAITARYGPIDVLHYAPAGLDWLTVPVDARAADAESFEFPLNMLLRTPVELVRLVLPGMLDRDRGAILFGLPVSASRAYPPVTNLCVAAAAARMYAQNLHVSLAGTGVYAGLLQVGGMIGGSEAADYVIKTRDPAALPKPLDAADLAEAVWQLNARRDQFEHVARPA